MVRIVNEVRLRILPRFRHRFAPDYDAPVAAFLQQRIRPGMTCVNVGTNVGVYTLQFAHWSAPGGQVIAFEPNPNTAAVLREHVALNGLSRRVRVIQAAVASQPGRATFHASGTDGMSRLGTPNPLLVQTETVQVDVTTLDLFCDQTGVRPDWILIDVEGFEVSVLRGARRILSTTPAVGVVVEMHPDAWAIADTSRGDLERLLGDLKRCAAPLTGQTHALGEHGLVHLAPA